MIIIYVHFSDNGMKPTIVVRGADTEGECFMVNGMVSEAYRVAQREAYWRKKLGTLVEILEELIIWELGEATEWRAEVTREGSPRYWVFESLVRGSQVAGVPSRYEREEVL
jgi:hypothetical protein